MRSGSNPKRSGDPDDDSDEVGKLEQRFWDIAESSDRKPHTKIEVDSIHETPGGNVKIEFYPDDSSRGFYIFDMPEGDSARFAFVRFLRHNSLKLKTGHNLPGMEVDFLRQPDGSYEPYIPEPPLRIRISRRVDDLKAGVSDSLDSDETYWGAMIETSRSIYRFTIWAIFVSYLPVLSIPNLLRCHVKIKRHGKIYFSGDDSGDSFGDLVLMTGIAVVVWMVVFAFIDMGADWEILWSNYDPTKKGFGATDWWNAGYEYTIGLLPGY